MGNPVNFDAEICDVFGRLKTTAHQSVYDSDFEYGLQPSRWESIALGAATITHQPQVGGIRMRVTTANGDATIRQSRPYHRYQPGKGQRCTGAVLLGGAIPNQAQRYGFFDDCNGAFLEQLGSLVVLTNPLATQAAGAITAATTTSITVAGTPFSVDQFAGRFIQFTSNGLTGRITANTANTITFVDVATGLALLAAPGIGTNYTIAQECPNPFGMAVVVRSDVNGTINETRVPLSSWNGGAGQINGINWNSIQMPFVEYAWYGVGQVRWGVTVQGRDIILHQIGFGNLPGRTLPWSRTPHLPVRYEQRNLGVTLASSDLFHWGSSVITEGRQDDQRGFTYGYGLAPQQPRKAVAANSIRVPVLSIRNRVMGTIEATQAGGAITAGTTTSITVSGTPWTVGQWIGRFVHFPNIALTGRITANTANTLTFSSVVNGAPLASAPAAATPYQIGLVNRGQILPRGLVLSCSAIAQIEVILSGPSNPIVLTGANWQALSALGSPSSFAERDVSATAMTGGEVINRITLDSSSGVPFDLSTQFALYTDIRGQVADILTIAATTPNGAAANIAVDFLCQEAMS